MTPTTAIGAVLLTLGVFAVVGTTGRARPASRDDYLSARASQRVPALALSLFASGMGVWILFTPPTVAAFNGIPGALGYGLAAAAPLVAFGVLGPRVRDSLPTGITLTDWVRLRHGRGFQLYVGLVSVFYMFMFVTAELTAIGQVVALPAFGATQPWLAIVGTAVVTAAYTAYGGLPASLRTDRWQGWLILALLATGLGALLFDLDAPLRTAVDGGLTRVDRTGVETAAVLLIAVTAANLFHQGYWQRMWAAADERVLRTATAWAAGLTFVTVLAVGLTGLVAAGLGEPSVPFFDVLAGLPAGIRLLVVVLAVALVASSVDTLESAMAALVSQDVSEGRLSMGAARLLTVALIIPACLIAVRGYDVLRLFLIADLVAAATVVPLFLGLGRTVTGAGALAGSLAGLAAVFVQGILTRGGLAGGWASLTVADAPTLDLGAFLTAVVVSTAVALATSRPAGRAEAGVSRSTSSPRRPPRARR